MGLSVATRHGLTDKQAAFIRHFVLTGDKIVAVRAAGYDSGDNPQAAAYDLLRSPQVMAALRLELARALQESAVLAFGVVHHIAKDEKMPAKVRLDAAKTLLDRAGHVAPRARAETGIDLPLNEMSVNELRDLADKLDSELASRAKDVSPANPAAIEDQAADLIG